MIHLYAFAASTLRAAVCGIDASPVTARTVGSLHALVSEHPVRLQASADTALAHVAAIEAAAEHADVVPVRFGPGHADLPALRDKLGGALPDLHRVLGRVGGHVEFVARPTIFARSEAAHQPPAEGDLPVREPGRAYLERRRDEEHASAEQLEALRHHVLAATEPLVDEAAAVQEVMTSRGPERCFLVARGAATAFGLRLRDLVDGSGSLVAGGPWPPFTFASLPPQQEGQ